MTKLADDHIPLLVFGIFNASVPKGEDEAEQPSVGSEVVFRVKSLDAQATPMMLLGKLGAKKNKKDKKEKGEKREREEIAPEEVNEPEKKKEKKQKKEHKKKKDEEENEAE